MYYSPVSKGFYDAAHPAIPEDAVAVDPETHAALIADQARGATIQPGPDGQPVAVWPAPPTEAEALAAAQARAHAAMADFIAGLTGRFTAGLPVAEVASWPTKAEAASRHLAGEPQPMIAAEAEITGEAPDDLARAILAKAALYTAIVARVTGLRRQTATAIDAAPSPEAVREVLIAAREAAEALLGEMGL